MRSFTYALLVAISLATSLAACNTMAGAGEDMKSGGAALQNSAEKNGAQQ